jgi:CBS domain containing-hemolysin-like protein
MSAIFIYSCFLFLYGVFTGYVAAVSACRHCITQHNETSQANIALTLLSWLEQPAHQERFPVFLQGSRFVILIALGMTLQSWLQHLPLETWGLGHFPPAMSPYAFWITAGLFFTIFFPILLISLILGEYVSKKLAILHPENFLIVGFPFISFFYNGMAGLFTLLANLGDLLFSQKQKERIRLHTNPPPAIEIRELVSDPQNGQEIPEPGREILSAVIDFNDMLVQQVTIPRTEVIAVESQTTLQQALEICLEKGVTKLPVYTNQLDAIEGVVHLRDLVLKLQEDSTSTLPAVSLIRETLFVPEAVPLHALLHQFRSKHMHMAIVLDEFGGTAGIVTLEDLLEEVFGEVLDPFESISPSIQVQKDGSFLVDGRMPIAQFNEYFHMNLTVPDYHTLAGYVLAGFNRIPQCGDTFEDAQNKILVTVKSMDRLRIEKVLIQFHLPAPLETPSDNQKSLFSH